MSDSCKHPLEVANLFVKGKYIDGIQTYKLVKIVLGRYDKNNKVFVDTKGNKYNHLSTLNGEKLGYAIRSDIKSIHETYGGDTIKQSLITYAKEFRFCEFYFGARKEDFSKIYFVCEKNFSHFQFLFDDPDIEFSLKTFSAQELSDAIKKKVIGQDEAIDDIVTVLWENMQSKVKQNMILVGPTGVGKTEIIKNIASELDVPVVVANAPGLTQSAYKGDSVSDVLLRLYKKADGNILKAQRGIIILDEFDKLARVSDDSISTSGVQDELLKLVEGNEFDLAIDDNPFSPSHVVINTEGITFIALGAFADLERQNKCVKKEGASIGFGAKVTDKNDTNVFYNEISSDDLKKYGFSPELVGRLPVIIRLNSITKDVLIKILNNPDSDFLSAKINILKNVGIKLKIENPNLFYDEVASIVLKKGLGVRGLNSVLEKFFSKAMCEISRSNGEYDELIIGNDIISDPKKYVLKRKKKNSNN